ncbi:PAS domain S-box protein [Tabrizicola sp. WMC-M-20]|nr:PAS domain S-box protein [Tabrizicola sp. WMC-M-20]
MNEFDWVKTPLGHHCGWSAEMKASISLMMASGFPMCSVWGPQRIQVYNDAYIPIFGAKHPAAFGAPAQESWKEIWEFLGPALDQIESGETLWFAETLLPLVRSSLPEECYFDFSYSPIRGGDGAISGILSVAAERTSEVVLRRRQKLLELDAAKDVDDPFQTLSQILCKVLVDNEMDCAAAVLYSVASETGAPDGEIWSLRANEGFVRKMRPHAARALRDGLITWIDYRATPQDADGVQVTCIPFHNLDGNPNSALVILPSHLVPYRSSFLPFAEAISKSVHAALHASERRQREVVQMRERIAQQDLLYQFLFENMQDGIAYCATNGSPTDDEVILAVNPRLCEMLGYEAEEVVGMSRDSFFFPNDGAVQAALERRGRECNFRGELQVRTKCGLPIPVELSSNLIEFRKGETRSLTLIRDISHHKHAEAERAERVRLETVANLAGSLAHDTNNLMTIVIGSTEFLSERLPQGGKEQQMALDAMVAAERASGLTNQLLIYARQQASVAQPIDLNGFLEEIRPLIVSSLGGLNDLTIKFEADLPPCLADPAQLTTAVLNLVTNARHAMPERGRLHIETFRQTTPTVAWEHVDAHPSLKFVGLRLEDNGTGIPLEIQDRVFEPFFTTKEVGSGSGLGLSIVQRLMNEVGGTLQMTSIPARGTMFELGFQIATLAEDDRGDREAWPKGQKLLYVEDNEIVRHQTESFLRQIGAEPIALGTGRQALEWLRAGGRASALLTDLVLRGGMSGLELAQAIRRSHPDLPIVITTGYDPRATLAEMGNRHFPVLRKPYTRRTLETALLRELRRH